ncbi:unnamed protein product [Rhizophagus irregularis]|uniref:Uncharacterized protein n=1 Tax=Rhizophagus irregularis TaxID=588596 RepID=A0A915Z526_9GLOM|nr:unnamed protein product [Rhizophagus irregularis]GBC15703.2 hypothetical protein GLOIN_2v1502756 [Rhizophagus irregularis DAOM 181602=DAOM 197198]CAB4479315.1 unnamed protein product [Rhizophagus irregularis]CAB5098898.1 unnamed protein product [Rhizophagus irregularis]CAB5297271.1 unnamed protein product [Rhizophagus irregularis]
MTYLDDHMIQRTMQNGDVDISATKVRLCYPRDQIKYETANIEAIKIPVLWDSHDYGITIDSTVVISLLYNNFEKQEMLFDACVQHRVFLFITWDSGMELDPFIKNKVCPRTRLHEKLLEHQNIYGDGHMHWILFQIGIFDEEILKYDVSTITTAFNCPNQYIFLNVTVKEDLAQLVVEAITSKKIQLDRNYVVGDFIAHTFLGHAYQVANNGAKFDSKMPATLSEFEITNQLRLTGIVSAQPLPQILYPDSSIYFQKLGIEISFQHAAIIYKILRHHRQITLKEWICKRIFG